MILRSSRQSTKANFGHEVKKASFSTSALMVGPQEGHSACKIVYTLNPTDLPSEDLA